MFRKEVTIPLKSDQSTATGELYAQPAKQGGIYLTIMLHGLDDLHTQSVLHVDHPEKKNRFPLPVPCHGTIELCLWSCMSLEALMQSEIGVYHTNGQKIFIPQKDLQKPLK